MKHKFQTRYVSVTGRALSPGRVTRASNDVKRAHDGRPLPFVLQCHPKALTPTTRNPDCETYVPWTRWYLEMLNAMRGDTAAFAQGKGLRLVPHPWLDDCIIQMREPLKRTFYHEDMNFALGWKHAAEDYGFKVDVYAPE